MFDKTIVSEEKSYIFRIFRYSYHSCPTPFSHKERSLNGKRKRPLHLVNTEVWRNTHEKEFLIMSDKT